MTVDSCAVCGRTILSGERTRIYLTPEGDSRDVCELCRDRAEASGWTWEEVAGQKPEPEDPERRRRSLGSLLRGRARRATKSLPESGSEDPEQTAEPPASGAGERNEDPAAAGADVRARPLATAGSRVERALSEFNGSEHSRTVAGLIRTLGMPQVTVGNGAGEPGAVRITVAWELTWYQWAVKVSGESAEVSQTGKGMEIAELDGPAREWNAHATDDGQLGLGLPAPLEGEPAQR
jgi:hypothetical protein